MNKTVIGIIFLAFAIVLAGLLYFFYHSETSTLISKVDSSVDSIMNVAANPVSFKLLLAQLL